MLSSAELQSKKPQEILRLRKKVLILRLSAIGDVVLSTASLNLAIDQVGAQQVVFIGEEPSLSLLKKMCPGPKYLALSSISKLEFLKEVEVVFDLQRNLKSVLFCFKLRKVARFKAFHYEKRTFFRFQILFKARLLGRSSQRKAFKVDFQFERMLACLNQYFSLETKELVKFYPKLSHSHLLSSPLVEDELCLAVAPGASYPNKRAPISFFSQVLTGFLKEICEGNSPKVRIVLLGDKKDSLIAKELISLLQGNNKVSDYTGKLSLLESSDLLSQAKVLLTNDTGLLHIAESLGTPVAALFGPTVEEFGFSPFLRESQTFSSSLGCRPCSRHGETPCRFKDQRCFTEISSVQVSRFLLSFFK